LLTDDAEGINVGMPVTFAGFPIGRVRRVELAPSGDVRVLVEVARRDAHWLRESSVFTQERSLVGGTRLRAYTGVLEGPPLADGAERRVLRGDALAELPRVANTARELLEQVKAMTDPDAPINASVRELQTLLQRANSSDGVLGALMGNAADRARVIRTLDETKAALQRVQSLLAQSEALVRRADERLLGEQGVVTDVQTGVRDLTQDTRALLADLRGSLQRVDAVLVEAQGIAANARAATVDLDALRAEVEGTLRRVDGMLLDLQRRWPLARDPQIPLP
jgi:phospholipid/cholesterol/gamma-HCH transport system substrate-binding protein